MVNIPGELAALPIEALIGKPLEAAIRAQAYAAMTTARFVQEVGLGEGGDPTKVKIVEFKYNRKVQNPQDGNVSEETTTLEVPLLSILPIPYIRIKDMTIHFNFTIKTTDTDTEQQTFTGKLSASAGWKWGGIKLNVSYSYNKTTRSQVDRSAELDITVNAVQDEMPEGLRTVLTLLNEAIAPQKTTS